MNLVYYSIGKDIRLIEFLKYSIQSLRINGKYTEDILIISDSTCIDLVKENFPECKIYHLEKNSSTYQSSINKLEIYSYENINIYDKIFYIDLDMMIQNNVDKLFELLDNKILISGDIGNIHTNQYYWGDFLFSDEEKRTYDIYNKIGMNCGFFGFKKEILHHIKNISDKIIEDNEINIHGVCEQPTMNKYLIINNLYNLNATDLILQHAIDKNLDMHKEKIVLHFNGGVGNYNRKLQPITNWFNRNVLK
jgi:hypothetical protein